MIYKKGQLTIFIIVAILIIGLVGVFFVFKDKIKINSTGIPASIEPLYTSVLSCLEETTKEGIYYLGLHGGYYTVPRALAIPYFTENLSYYYLNSRTYIPSRDRVENELSDYISENLYKCLNFETYTEDGFNISEGNITVETDINQESAIVKMKYPLSIKKGETTNLLQEFETEVVSKVDLFLDVSSEIVASYSEKPGYVCLTCLEETSNENNVKITATPMQIYKENIIWFTITENLESDDQSENELKWIFGVEE